MTPEQKDTYINLLENFKNVIVKNNKGWRLDELAAIKAIEEFENNLPCNQESGLTQRGADLIQAGALCLPSSSYSESDLPA